MGQLLTKFSGKDFSEICYQGFPNYLVFLPEFPEFSVGWLGFHEFNSIRIFWKLSQETFGNF